MTTQHSLKLTTSQVIWLAILMAMQMVLSKLSIGSDTLVKVGFGFIGTALLGYFFGPFWAAFASGADDIIGFFLGGGGTFYFGFTLSAIVAGALYGYWLHDRPVSWKYTILGVLSVTIIVNMLMNTLWVRLMYQTPWTLLISWRLLKQLISAPLQVVLLYTVFKVLVRVPGTAQLQR
ncbi:folate family ECF transporter S component [Schleiferilactobacillus shenzhenensis]|nr:folate family ECF transporter S component [Schleiferilactobacillus shenzhenensis]